MTTAERPYPTRVAISLQKKRGQVALDQIRAVDRQRLVRKLGAASEKTAQAVSATLVEMFSRGITGLHRDAFAAARNNVILGFA